MPKLSELTAEDHKNLQPVTENRPLKLSELTPEVAKAVQPVGPEPSMLDQAGSAIKSGAESAYKTGKEFLASGSIGEEVPVIGPIGRLAGEAFRAVAEGGVVDAFRGDKESVTQAFQRIHAENEAGNRQFEANHPVADITKKVTGALATPVLGGGSGLWGVLGRVGTTAGISHADTVLRTGDIDAARKAGATTGGIQLALETIPYAGKVAGPVASKIADASKSVGSTVGDWAATRAAKAAFGNFERPFRELGEKGVIKAGRAALDSGAVRFGDKAAAILRRSKEIGGRSWDKVEGVMKSADAAGNRVSGDSIAEDILNRASKMEQTPKNLKRIDELQKEAEFFSSKGDMTLKEAQDLKKDYTWKNVENKVQDVLGKNGNNLVNRSMSDAIKRAAKKSGVDGAETFADEYKKFGDMATIRNGAEKAARADTKNATFGLRDTILAGGALAGVSAYRGDLGEGGVAAWATMLASSVAKKRFNASVASSLNKVATVMTKSPDKLGAAYRVLERAAENGAGAFVATHEKLLKEDPKYRKAIENDDAEKNKGARLSE